MDKPIKNQGKPLPFNSTFDHLYQVGQVGIAFQKSLLLTWQAQLMFARRQWDGFLKGKSNSFT